MESKLYFNIIPACLFGIGITSDDYTQSITIVILCFEITYILK